MLKWAFTNLLRVFRSQENTVAIFHPYCNAGGGGERVLYQIIQSLQKTQKIVIYSSEKIAALKLKQNAYETFGINCDFEIVEIDDTWIKPRSFLTILLQILGSFFVAFFALWKHWPQVVIDTSTDFTGIFPVFWLFGVKVVTYTHYPVVSGMSRNESILNTVYLWIVTGIYRFNGLFIDLVIANSKWTKNHLAKFWKNIEIVYPSCALPNSPINAEKAN